MFVNSSIIRNAFKGWQLQRSTCKIKKNGTHFVIMKYHGDKRIINPKIRNDQFLNYVPKVSKVF